MALSHDRRLHSLECAVAARHFAAPDSLGFRGPLHDDVDVEDDVAFERWDRRAQRAGLGVLAIVVVVSTMGYLGNGRIPGARAVAVYGFLLLAFRLVGKRTLAQMTSFDLLVILIRGDIVAPALVSEQDGLIGVIVAVSVLASLDVTLGYVQLRWPAVDRVVDGCPSSSWLRTGVRCGPGSRPRASTSARS